MTVTTTISVKQASGNGSTTVFAYPYKILDGAHFVVTTLITATGVINTHTKDGAGTYDYTVAVAGDQESANITFTTAPPSGYEITIDRQTTNDQQTDYTPNDDFPAETHELALDRGVMQHQELFNDYESNAFRFGADVADQGTVEIVKTAAERASKVVGFDSSGDLIATQELGTSRGSWATATAYLERDVVVDGANSAYICVTAHTSTGSSPISSNADVAKWDLIIDGAATAADAVSTAADAVSTAADAVSTAADAVSTAADVVTTGEIAGAVALPYIFSTTTSMADPAGTFFRANSATPASITAFAFGDTTSDAVDLSAWLADWADSTSTITGNIRIVQQGTPANSMVFDVTAVVDNTDWLQVTVAHVAGTTLFTNASTCRITFTRTGDKGDTGATGATGPAGGGATIADILSLG